MNAYQIGQRVTSKTDRQGLTIGATYTVANITRQILPWGTFVTYYLQDNDGTEYSVLNGHLLLTTSA